jgi:hypothetical protein
MVVRLLLSLASVLRWAPRLLADLEQGARAIEGMKRDKEEMR